MYYILLVINHVCHCAQAYNVMGRQREAGKHLSSSGQHVCSVAPEEDRQPPTSP